MIMLCSYCGVIYKITSEGVKGPIGRHQQLEAEHILPESFAGYRIEKGKI